MKHFLEVWKKAPDYGNRIKARNADRIKDSKMPESTKKITKKKAESRKVKHFMELTSHWLNSAVLYRFGFGSHFFPGIWQNFQDLQFR